MNATLNQDKDNLKIGDIVNWGGDDMGVVLYPVGDGLYMVRWQDGQETLETAAINQ